MQSWVLFTKCLLFLCHANAILIGKIEVWRNLHEQTAYRIRCTSHALKLCSCASGNVTIDYGESKLYSNDDMDAAIQVIRETFDTFDGCKLYSLSYAGDETCEESLPYCQSLSEEHEITQCIVFGSRSALLEMAEAHGRQTQNIPGRGILQKVRPAIGFAHLWLRMMRAHVRPFFNFLRTLRAANASTPNCSQIVKARGRFCRRINPLKFAFLCLPVFPTDVSMEQASMANRFQFALRLAYRFAHPESKEILF